MKFAPPVPVFDRPDEKSLVMNYEAWIDEMYRLFTHSEQTACTRQLVLCIASLVPKPVLSEVVRQRLAGVLYVGY